MAVQAPHLQEHPPAVALRAARASSAGGTPAKAGVQLRALPSGPRPSPGYGISSAVMLDQIKPALIQCCPTLSPLQYLILLPGITFSVSQIPAQTVTRKIRQGAIIHGIERNPGRRAGRIGNHSPNSAFRENGAHGRHRPPPIPSRKSASGQSQYFQWANSLEAGKFGFDLREIVRP